ncbi:CoA transferase [Nocardioides campestrisoli]|uniref:CoA transferase n=1 Tax=Nocardioides campestrisoli TaxID=2736757 RepID=UPI0015E7474A|nr:CoA transferase [Nocardioides campestrisoli]
MTTTPLAHLKVVECATFVAGPSCGMNLAQLGAEVTRVDLPGGGSDHLRWPLAGSGASLYWANLNKGKRSVLLDYRTPEGRELLLALSTRPGPGAGILVDNLVGRHRVTHADLTARRPDAISMHVLGFPDGRPAVDYTVNAAVGVPSMTGPVSSHEPVNHVLPAWDLLTGSAAALGVLAAVNRREQTGEGSRIDLALADVALSAVGAVGWLAEAEQVGSRAPHGNHVFGSFGTDFATADGQRVMVVALTEGQWRALCEVTSTTPVFSALETALDTDLRLESNRYELRETIASILRPWFAARPLDELTSVLDRARVLWGPYRTMDEAAEIARRDAGSVARPITQPGIGEMLATGNPLRWDEELAAPVPAPVLGADTERVLAEDLGLSSAEIGRLHDGSVVGSSVDGDRLR